MKTKCKSSNGSHFVYPKRMASLTCKIINIYKYIYKYKYIDTHAICSLSVSEDRHD